MNNSFLKNISQYSSNFWIIILIVFYFIIQIVLLVFLKEDTSVSLSVIPILFIAWYKGPLLASIFGFILIILYTIFKISFFGFSSLVDISIGASSIFIFTIIGIVIGKIEQLNRLLKIELNARKAAEQQLARSNKELEQFAYIASHDLQEPLRKISAFSSRLMSKYKDIIDPQGLDYLQRMQNASNRMQDLINGLLTYSRVTTKANPFVKVNLLSVVNEVLLDLETSIKDKNAIVKCEVDAEIEADPLQMRQLFQNLIGNSLKYQKPEVAPFVLVKASVNNDKCTIIIRDNGIGFEQKYAEQIFGVFVRLHGQSSQYHGSGIGLSVCKKIVERHNGTITAESELDKGATFTIILPVKQKKEN